MASKALAVKYRPQTFEEVTEQEILTTILKQQISSKQIQHCYLFCGPAGCGQLCFEPCAVNCDGQLFGVYDLPSGN